MKSLETYFKTDREYWIKKEVKPEKIMGYWETGFVMKPDERHIKYNVGPTMQEWEENQEARKKEAMDKVAFMTYSEKTACLEYIEASKSFEEYRGFAGCRICGATLGTRDMITPDNKFVFPEKWEHYIIEHGVRPDDEFIRSAISWISGSI